MVFAEEANIISYEETLSASCFPPVSISQKIQEYYSPFLLKRVWRAPRSAATKADPGGGRLHDITRNAVKGDEKLEIRDTSL